VNLATSVGAAPDSGTDYFLDERMDISPPGFLHDVAQALNGHEIGDGLVMRTCKDIQKKYYDPPDLSHAGSGKYR
jgi:hypothetical protein